MVVLYFIERREGYCYPTATLTEIATQTLAVFYRGLADGDSLYLVVGTRDTIPRFVRAEVERVVEENFNVDLHRVDHVIAGADYRLRERDSLEVSEKSLLLRMMNGIEMIPLGKR